MRNSLPPKTVKVGLAALVAAFVLLSGASVPDNPDPPRLDAGPSGEASFSSRGELTGLSGGTLVFRADRANVILRTTPGVDGSVMAVGSAVGRRLRPPGGPPAAVADIEVETSGRTMTVAPATDGDDVTYTFTLPEDVEVDIEVMSGTIEGRLAGAHGVLRTADGDISVDLADGAEEGTAGDGPYLFDTDSGQIRIDSTLAVTLDLRADSGDVTVDGESTEARYRSPAGTIGAVVVARSESGDIHVDAPPARQGP